MPDYLAIKHLHVSAAGLSLALFVLPYVFPWVSVDSMGAALVAALVLGLVNALIRPLAILLTLPATILTLGLFIFVINGLLFWWVGSFLEGFRVAGFWPVALRASLRMALTICPSLNGR